MQGDDKTVVIGVTGGIAAYKIVSCASALSQRGCDVHVLMSPGASEFIRPLTFAAVTGNRVIDSGFPDTVNADGTELYPHIYPAMRADLFLLAPASADMLAKIAHGFGDDIVCASALALSKDCKKIFCPAMHVNMWAQPSVQENSQTLVSRGWLQVGPETGKLACGSEGPGRMSEPEDITEKVVELVG